ncbi:hypothetical protein FOZ63_008131 [Perkinsus olseni]|uniref:Uncharacterized protein n=1 Tax=Perkinsus olseni TaxID=32597 RepID=A0A7J6R0C2_PEROL|nr:hypothetical protein FOZ63_008131 [Perkinsus olseni]KAF4715591.1 hypothetical protein FOZ62_011110 [Perkinsus olseni]
MNLNLFKEVIKWEKEDEICVRSCRLDILRGTGDGTGKPKLVDATDIDYSDVLRLAVLNPTTGVLVPRYFIEWLTPRNKPEPTDINDLFVLTAKNFSTKEEGLVVSLYSAAATVEARNVYFTLVTSD